MTIFMSNVLITGGAGFVGSNLADRLVAQGDKVTIVDDLSMGLVENIPYSLLILHRMLLNLNPECFQLTPLISHQRS